MAIHRIEFWKQAPFARYLIAFISGILFQWKFHFAQGTYASLLILVLFVAITFFSFPIFERFRLAPIPGTACHLGLFALGAILTSGKDIRNDPAWVGNLYKESDAIVVTLQESPIPKPRSLKAVASIHYLLRSRNRMPVKGNLLLYFNPIVHLILEKGSQLIIRKQIREITDAGNPGSFDFKQNCLFRQITHQVFLDSSDYIVLPSKDLSRLGRFFFSSRESILATIRTYVPGERERGLAEALLIGYKEDLDPVLVQSYTRTGVVHIIAISGLHLGLIYWLLLQLFRPLRKNKKLKWVRPLFIIAGLWIFSLLSGAQPSILRSALMFTCIVLGNNLSKHSSIYNGLALSAFLLLVYNPFWLWDPGFQLSHAAVFSILLFQRSIYLLWLTDNKILDQIWKTCAISLAAQILTAPISIYHFHQFPNYFLLTNVLAVPLSSLLLLGEILLCAIGSLPVIAIPLGKSLAFGMQLMNQYIERIESLPFAVWNALQISPMQTILLFCLVFGIRSWLFEGHKSSLLKALLACLLIFGWRTQSFFLAARQKMIIVYNLPRRTGIDFISGRNHFLIGTQADPDKRNSPDLVLQSSRIYYRLKPAAVPEGMRRQLRSYVFEGKRILFWSGSISILPSAEKMGIDLLVLSGNPPLDWSSLRETMDIRQVVADGSSPLWKKSFWKKTCEDLAIPYSDVTVDGAFVIKIP